MLVKKVSFYHVKSLAILAILSLGVFLGSCESNVVNPNGTPDSTLGIDPPKDNDPIPLPPFPNP